MSEKLKLTGAIITTATAGALGHAGLAHAEAAPSDHAAPNKATLSDEQTRAAAERLLNGQFKVSYGEHEKESVAPSSANDNTPAGIDTDRSLSSGGTTPFDKATLASELLIEAVDKGKVPNVAMTGILKLPAGTFLAYGPNEGSPGVRVPKGQTGFGMFGQMFDYHGKLTIRFEVYPDAAHKDQADDGPDSRYVSVNQRGLSVMYPIDMDPNKGYPRSVAITKDENGNFKFNTESANEPLPGMPIGALFTLPNRVVKDTISHDWGLMDPKPGRLPTLADIPKLHK